MKIYILTCINEDADLVYCQPFWYLAEAQNTMKEMYEAERREFESNERLDDDYDVLSHKFAVIGNCDYHYNFRIDEREL